MSVGTRDVIQVEKSPLHGSYKVVGATSGHIIHSYSYDERPRFTEQSLLNNGVQRDMKAWRTLSALIRGSSKTQAKALAWSKAVATSSVVTKWDR